MVSLTLNAFVNEVSVYTKKVLEELICNAYFPLNVPIYVVLLLGIIC